DDEASPWSQLPPVQPRFPYGPGKGSQNESRINPDGRFAAADEQIGCYKKDKARKQIEPAASEYGEPGAARSQNQAEKAESNGGKSQNHETASRPDGIRSQEVIECRRVA